MDNITPATLDLELYQGADFKKIFEDVDDALDFANSDFFCEIRNNPDDKIIYTFTTANLYISSGLLIWEIPAELSREWIFNNAKYDIAIKKNGIEYKLIRGNIRLIKEITENTETE